MSRGKLHAVIIAGGAGERFWPASRQKRPKPFLRVVDGRTLLEATLVRARRFAAKDCVWIVCGREHARDMRRETGLPAQRVLVEPRRRNTAMAVAFAAQHIAGHDPNAVLAVLPADHRIPDARAFASAIRKAAAGARDGALLTLGVRPTRAETGYGYLQLGSAVGRRHAGLRRVKRFVEKPDAARARRYLRSGDYLWNAGIFVFGAQTILDEIREHAPELHRALAPLRQSPRVRSGKRVAAAYLRAPSLPIDVAVMERSRKVWTLPLKIHWSDVGTWLSLAEELGVFPGGTQVLGGELLFDERGGNLVWGQDGRGVALLGVEGLAVIETPDVLLVTKLESSPDVRKIVAQLKRRGRTDLT
ncbi:MAG: NTP transferase domain-containing protein [Deltaproteobacteria bacterium]|nr:NTP transferase domain-containing protein [Deltaproteobacteria bacterium]MBW2360328.1 NTP transferase domain-containing protein [Deltaproteobacteria bacterium]